MAKTRRKEAKSRKAQQRIAAVEAQDRDLLSSGFSGFSRLGELAELSETSGRAADWENAEQSYELQPRVAKRARQDAEDDVREALPIITKEGVKRKVKRVEKRKSDETEEKAEDSEDAEDSENSENSEHSDKNPESTKKSEKSTGHPEIEDDSQSTEPLEERIHRAKEEIAAAVEKLNENPEENISQLTKLLRMTDTTTYSLKKLALLSLVPVFKSLIPGYAIRPLTAAEEAEKVSRDVALLRHFEAVLLKNYREYIDVLNKLIISAHKIKQEKANNPAHETRKTRMISLADASLAAACELLARFSYFNYHTELVQILVRKIDRGKSNIDKSYWRCIDTLTSLLTGDDRGGQISREITQQVARMLRQRRYAVDESVVNLFLSLTVLEGYAVSEEESEPKEKIRKKDRVHLSKKERKNRKEMQKIAEEFRRAETAVSAQETERNQAEVLKTVLTTYLGILRDGPSELLAAVLEGLARFGHLANAELLGDFLAVLKEVVDVSAAEESASGLQRTLLAIAAACALVEKQKEFKVPVDLTVFVNRLYGIVYRVAVDAEIELSSKTLRLADPLKGAETREQLRKSLVNKSTKIEVFIKSLDHVFFALSRGNQSSVRVEAFGKRLAAALLQLPEKSAIAVVRFLERLQARYGVLNGLFSTEDRVLNGVYSAEAETPEVSNAAAATVWEVVLLRHHYSPTVVKGVKSLVAKAKQS